MLKNYFKILEKSNSNFKNTEIITYEDMLKVPFGEILLFSKPGEPLIIGTKIPNINNDISFRMEMEKASIFRVHKHDCKEIIIMYKGVIIDAITEKEATRGQTLIFPKFISHNIKAKTSSIFYVEFKKDN